MPEQVNTMSDVVCSYGCYYRFEGDIGVCPRCGEYASVTIVSFEERQQMQAELALVLTAIEQRLSADAWAEPRSDLGR
jgi:uncharacterized paraquat-inducible protein A